MKKYTTKQQNIINDLHEKDYFYTHYINVKENVRKKYKVSKEYMQKLIAKEMENIKNNYDKDTLIYIKNFG